MSATTPPDNADHWELIRALGAAVLTAAPDNGRLFTALGLPRPSRADCTDTFVLNLPPHAAIHLGAEGMLGGEALDRVAGCWRVLRLTPPADADHLGSLLMLYASLGEGALTAQNALVRERLAAAQAAVLAEHIWSWAPGYLSAVAEQSGAALAAWSRLAFDVLTGEAQRTAAACALPLALRSAPAALSVDASMNDVLDAAIAPIRSGMILTFRDLATCAAAMGAGIRRGERRYALKFLLHQDPAATLERLGAHAAQWSSRHASRDDATSMWWTERARRTAQVLAVLSARQLSAAGASTSS